MDEHHTATAVGVEIAEDKKAGDKEVGPGKLVKLRAFNLFAAKVRDSIKDEHPVASGHEIKRIVGQKWAQLEHGDKQEFLEVAQNENDLIEKLPVDPNARKRRRRRRTKAEIEMEDGLTKKRGRPRKSEDEPNDEESNGMIPNAEEEPKRTRMMRKPGGDAPAAGNAVVSDYVGRSFSGTVDGSFDAGYLVTVRVGDTDMVFRGVLFEPFISNNVVPPMKLVRRNNGLVFPPTGSASTSKQILGGPGLASGTMSSVKLL